MLNSRSQQLAQRGEVIYQKKLKELLEPKYNGQFVAIEVDSGDYFLGDTPLDAIHRGKEKYPDKPFHVMRVGPKTAFNLKSNFLKQAFLRR